MSLINFEGAAAPERKLCPEDRGHTALEASVPVFRGGKLPPFSGKDPAFWISRMDTYFSCCGVTDQVVKYNIAANEIPEPFASDLRDVLIGVPASDPYDKLRDAILSRFSESRSQRVRRLLAGETLGDRKPSQFLRHLQHLLGDDAGQGEQELLRELFLQRMPEATRLVLSACEANVDISTLACMADRMHDCAYFPVHAAAKQSKSTFDHAAGASAADISRLHETIHRLEQRVSALTDELHHMKVTYHSSLPPAKSVASSEHSSRSKDRSGPKYSRRSPSRSRTLTNGQCYYHDRYGESAHSCYAGCKHFAPKGPPCC